MRSHFVSRSKWDTKHGQVQIIHTRSFSDDQYLISKAVLGAPLFTENVDRYTAEKYDTDMEDLNNHFEANGISEDEKFAENVFYTASKMQNILLENHQEINFSTDSDFLQFWHENGHFLCWYQFSQNYPEFKNKKQFDSAQEKLWVEMCDNVFGYSQLYWAYLSLNKNSRICHTPIVNFCTDWKNKMSEP